MNSHSGASKSGAKNAGVFYILTCKRASRHSGVQFFDIRTSKTWSGAEVFCTFWRANVLRATAACHFSTSKLPKGSQDRQFSNVLRATAACHLPAALASLLFDLADPQIIAKTQRFATCLTFRACGSSFYWLSRNCILFLPILLLFSAFHLLTLLLCSAFSTVHNVGSYTSKLPLII